MRKIFLLILITLISIGSFAQRTHHAYAAPVSSVNENNIFFNGNGYSRTTGNVGDTMTLSNIPVGDPQRYLYSVGVDSGYFTGTDVYGDQSFAEQYSFGENAVTVIGVFAQFGGTVTANSAKTVMFNIWSADAPEPITTTLFYSGFPLNILVSDTVSITQLGIGPSEDTLKEFLFASDSTTSTLLGSFFVGYSITYTFDTLNGDTIGLLSSGNGTRSSITSPDTTYSTVINDSGATIIDTLINIQNCTQYSDNNWYNNLTQDDFISNDLAIFPIVILGAATEVKGVTRNNLTFYGCYPNPAVNSTNIKFSLANNEDVTIQVMDMSGHLLNTISLTNQVAGEHIIPVNTTDMVAGNYLYLIRTSGGAGIASKMTIVK